MIELTVDELVKALYLAHMHIGDGDFLGDVARDFIKSIEEKGIEASEEMIYRIEPEDSPLHELVTKCEN